MKIKKKNYRLYTVLSFSIVLAFLTSCSKSENSNTQPPTTDSFTVTVTNGYGNGKYKAGDTVHIFSSNFTSNQLFDKWGGDISILNAPDEWHTWFIMPNKDVTLTGSLKSITPFTVQYEQIMGKDRLKPVYYYFPGGAKGIVYLLHGTNGSAANLVNAYEWMQMIKDLVNDKFAIIITEAEESTTKVDKDGDGKLRWQLLPADTIANVDYANIRIITDTFYNRGVINRNISKYSAGMSDGGFFSAALSYIYNFKASVQYCAQGGSNIMQITTIPTQFCMAANDDNSSVGAAGNAAALSFFTALNNRGICSKYYINQRSPIYPERFALYGDIPISQSVAIYTELKSKGFIDNKNYFIGYSDNFINAYQSNPSGFPVINSLTLSQIQTVTAQINIAVADHHIYSDYDRATLKFLNTQCH